MALVKLTKLDEDTGEILLEKQWRETGELIPFRQNSRYTKSFHTSLVTFSNDSYYKYWYILTRHLEPNTNRLVSIKRVEGRWLRSQPLSKDEIQSLVSIKKTTFYSFLAECKKNHYLAEIHVDGGRKAYYVNPVYELNGNSITVELYLFFEGTIIEQYVSEEGRKFIELYLGTNQISRHGSKSFIKTKIIKKQ